MHTSRKNAVVEEMEGGPRYRKGDHHGDRESHRKVCSSSDPFRSLLGHHWEGYSKSGSQELIDQDGQRQCKL